MKWRMNSKAFTLVEIMVVMVVMGLVTVAVYSTFLSSQRQAYTQDEVIEVQQNLRAALDYLAKDIRMASFMAPAAEKALENAPVQMLVDDNTNGVFEDNTTERPLLSLVSATSMHGYARITSDVTGAQVLTLAPNTVQQFVVGDVVRAYNPVDLTPVFASCEISAFPADDQVQLDTSVTVSSGDLLVLLPTWPDPDTLGVTDSFPLQIDYRLIDDGDSTDPEMNQLQRRVINQAGNTVEDWQVVASKISGLNLTYLDDAGDSTADLDEIVAVQITMTAQTDATKTGKDNFSGVKTRSLSTTVKIHNEVRL